MLNIIVLEVYVALYTCVQLYTESSKEDIYRREH